jgi:L-alanine-DL-glutamate epimerase-like enolase superfamily enzyme
LTGGRLSDGFPNFQHFDDIAHLPKALELFPLDPPPVAAPDLILRDPVFGLREFMPHFREQAMDVAIIERCGTACEQSMKIAALAEAREANVAPHNFYGHLCTMMNAHFAAAVPNLRIMEIDIDRLARDDELVTHLPQIEAGHLIVPDRAGWGTEPARRLCARTPRSPRR